MVEAIGCAIDVTGEDGRSWWIKASGVFCCFVLDPEPFPGFAQYYRGCICGQEACSGVHVFGSDG